VESAVDAMKHGDSTDPKPVITRTASSGSTDLASFKTSSPSMPGILRSVTRRSMPLCFRCSIPRGPEAKETTSYPSLRSASSMPRRFPSSSSMTTI